MASEVKGNLQPITPHNSLETIQQNVPIVAVATETLESSKQEVIPFNDFLKKLHKIVQFDKNFIHMFLGLNGNYIVRSNTFLISMEKTKEAQFQFKDLSNTTFTVEVKENNPSFHITPNHVWEKIIESNKSAYKKGAQKIQKEAISEQNVLAARLVCKNKKNRENFHKEFQLLKQFNNQRGIVQVLDLVEGCNKYGEWRLTIYEQLYAHRDMTTFLSNLPSIESLNENEITKVTEDLLHGLYAIHKAGVVHRDLKPENILFGEGDHELVSVICDFDLALKISDERINIAGTIKAFSPEKIVASYDPHSQWTVMDEVKADIWALGVILYELRWNTTPPWITGGCIHNAMSAQLNFFAKFTENSHLILPIRAMIGANTEKSFFPEPNQNENPTHHLVWRMCQFDPKLRPTMEEVLATWNAIPAQN